MIKKKTEKDKNVHKVAQGLNHREENVWFWQTAFNISCV